MSRVYIAAPLPCLASVKYAAELLARGGLEVVSTWHDGEPTAEAERSLSVDEQADIAERCLGEVELCNVLLLLYCAATTRHGSVFEAAWAARGGKAICAVALLDSAAIPTILLRAAPRLHRAALPLHRLDGALAWHVREAAKLPPARFGGDGGAP